MNITQVSVPDRDRVRIFEKHLLEGKNDPTVRVDPGFLDRYDRCQPYVIPRKVVFLNPSNPPVT